MLTLKNIKYAAFKSEETHCYEAMLYFGPTKVARVSNDGHGGADDVQWLCTRPRQEQVLEWISANLREPRKPEFASLYANATPYSLLEFWCADAVNSWLAEKELKRLLSKRVLWTRKGQPGIYQTQTAKSQEIKERWIQQTAADPDVETVLNSLPMETALQLFKERT